MSSQQDDLQHQSDTSSEMVLQLEDGSRLRISVKVLPPTSEEIEDREYTEYALDIHLLPKNRSFFSNLSASIRRWFSSLQNSPGKLGSTLFVSAICVYLLTRLIGLSDYPIYFFTDEAIQTNLAADLVNNGVKYEGTFLPTYFKNVDKYNLSLSVYAQIFPYLYFGKSIFITRAVSVFTSLLAAWTVGKLLEDFFKVPYWFVGVLILSITPAWFLHSRTAFETVLMVSLYAGFLYFYLHYRFKKPSSLYLAMLFGSLAFYAYSPGRVVIVLTGIFLVISDFKYHRQQWKTALVALGVLLICVLPFIRFLITHPAANTDHLRMLASYWVQPIPLSEKISQYLKEYFYGLSPGYWYLKNDRDLARHLMGSYGNLWLPTLPFLLTGLILTFTRLKQPAYRLLLFTLLAAPSGAAIVGIGITRTLVFVIPVALLTSLGLIFFVGLLEKIRDIRIPIAVSLFIVFSAFNFYLLGDALINGPLWETDYGLSGMQFGAKQLFTHIQEYQKQNPQDELTVSSIWANGPDIVARFFLKEINFEFGSADSFLFTHVEDSEHKVLVAIPQEYGQIVESGKFSTIDIVDRILCPDGSTCFYFLKLKYSDKFEDILAREMAERRTLVKSSIEVNGQPAIVLHSQLDIGEMELVFDGDPFTVTRTIEANPYVMEFSFQQPLIIHSMELTIGSADLEVTLITLDDDGKDGFSQIFHVTGSVDHPTMKVILDDPQTARHFRVSIFAPHEPEPGHVHLWELTFE
ncbi:MAG: hypothetical protein JXA19_03240 [Anaerolineales bacterium]|nr:hypothetical protein [Anaerolineales bacterium]